jgi:hypothetical protein
MYPPGEPACAAGDLGPPRRDSAADLKGWATPKHKVFRSNRG